VGHFDWEEAANSPAMSGVGPKAEVKTGYCSGGLTSRIHAVVDTNGLPVRLAGTLLSRLKSGTMLLADRGYDADWIRALVRQHGGWANIPPKRNRFLASDANRKSNKDIVRGRRDILRTKKDVLRRGMDIQSKHVG
jgi:transposase